MKKRLPHFANTLLFRISATFLLLMGVSLGGYYLWIERTVFNPYGNDEEQRWYEDTAEGEIQALAGELGAAGGDTARTRALLAEYGRRIRGFDAEVIYFDAAGRNLQSSAPESLLVAVPGVSAQLLADMSGDGWDFGVYPEPSVINAYENRIFEVDRVLAPDGVTTAGYLSASYFPVTVLSDDLNSDSRMIAAQKSIFKVLTGLLIYSAVTALLIMAWTGRRVQRLSAGVEVFAAGDLSHRMPIRSTDEIGTLARNFNSMAEHIESMVEKLRQKEQFQRQLIANVSHDLRTPMASMRGYVDTMLLGGGLPENETRYLKIIAGNLEHLDRLVEHMLVLSRFDSGQATFQFEDFSIAELADSILGRFEGLAAEMGVGLDFVAEGDVGLVRADPLQIAQVLQNLVENGIKFNRPGGSVVVALARQNERVAIEVRDTGRGIAAEDLPHIFERFYTGDKSRTRTASGTDSQTGSHLGQSSGLGLAIAAKIVAGHDSVLRVESLENKGSVFRFQLDHAEPEAQERAAGA